MLTLPPLIFPQLPPIIQSSGNRKKAPLIIPQVIPPKLEIESFDDDPDRITKLTLPELELLCVKCNQLLTEDIEQAIECGEWAAQRAYLLGRAFLQVKKLMGHGGWQNWIETYLPSTSIETARRYMRLAKGNRESVLQGKGLCSAYRASGILPATPSAKTKSPSTSTPSGQSSKSERSTFESLIDQLINELQGVNAGRREISHELASKCEQLQCRIGALLKGVSTANKRKDFSKTGQR